MRQTLATISFLGLCATGAVARDVPANVKALYDSIRSSGTCSNVLQGGFFSQEGDSQGKIYSFLDLLPIPMLVSNAAQQISATVEIILRTRASSTCKDLAASL